MKRLLLLLIGALLVFSSCVKTEQDTVKTPIEAVISCDSVEVKQIESDSIDSVSLDSLSIKDTKIDVQASKEFYVNDVGKNYSYLYNYYNSRLINSYKRVNDVGKTAS